MRKVLSVILAAGLALGLTACSGGGGTTDTTAANTSESTAAESSEAKEESGRARMADNKECRNYLIRHLLAA